jgi:hypothetical protein
VFFYNLAQLISCQEFLAGKNLKVFLSDYGEAQKSTSTSLFATVAMAIDRQGDSR